MSLSPSALRCCLRASARNFASMNQAKTQSSTIGPYTFWPALKLLLNQEGSKLRLTEKETSILRYLYRAGERPASRERLLQEVWGYNSGVTTHTLETHIYRLRQKIRRRCGCPSHPGH